MNTGLDVRDSKSAIWFSHKENRYDAELKLFQKYFYWTDESQTWDWDNCAVTWIRKPEQQVHVVIRSSKLVSSKYRSKTVRVKYMLGFDIRAEDIHYPINDNYHQPLDNIERRYGPAKPRWAFQLNKHYYIWQWAEEDQNGLANHAMSFLDTNHKIWKWEYVPWEEDSAIIYDEKPRYKVARYLWPK